MDEVKFAMIEKLIIKKSVNDLKYSNQETFNTRMKQLFNLLLILFSFEISTAQISEKVYFSPGISLGYCLTSHGWSFGLSCDIGNKKAIKDHENLYYGLSICKSWTGAHQGGEHFVHRHTTINFLLESEIVDFKMGYGIAKNPSGYLKARKCRVGGLNMDLSMSKVNYPGIGLRAFYYKRRNWRWLDKPYYTPYVKYEYDFKN